MILPFSTQFNGKPNYFIEKIWEGLIEKETSPKIRIDDMIHYMANYSERFAKCWDAVENKKARPVPKIHTIRKDSNHRWCRGRDIHFYINNRSRNAFQFAPVVMCTGIQTISIHYTNTDFRNTKYPITIIDGQWVITEGVIEKLAINDGFESIEAFYEYFNEDFEGKIIHWTNLRYSY